MTGKQTAVLWLGLLLIAVQFYFGGQIQSLLGALRAPPVNTPPPSNKKNSAPKRTPTGPMGTVPGPLAGP